MGFGFFWQKNEADNGKWFYAWVWKMEIGYGAYMATYLAVCIGM